MREYKIVIDTNVIFAGLYSSRGKSYQLLQIIDNKNIRNAISVPLILEYEDVLLRKLDMLKLTKSDIHDFLNYICTISDKRKIFYLWRPLLKDHKDDMILELAVEPNSEYIITYNLRDFNKAMEFGINVITPGKFLQILE